MSKYFIFSELDELNAQIDFAIANPDHCKSIREDSHQFVKEFHNYENRITQIFNN